jgi:hypothetical protein
VTSSADRLPRESSPRNWSQRVERSEQCAVQAGVRGDPMLGTAFPASMLLLVEQPGPWGRAGLLDSRFDRATAHALIGGLDRRGIRVVAIRRPGRSTVTGPRRWAISDCRPGRERLVWGQFDNDADLLELDVPSLVAGPTGTYRPAEPSAPSSPQESGPLFAVCAHGTHDVCCAIRGRPVAAALDRLRPGSVWECSHVGGDRFAANVLVLPSGVLYGRVVESAAAPLVDATERGTVLQHHLRGRVGFPPDVQAAMAFAHRERPDLRLTDVLVVGGCRIAPDETEVRLRLAGELVDVRIRAEPSAPQWMTCQAAAPSRAIGYQPLSIRTVPEAHRSAQQ